MPPLLPSLEQPRDGERCRRGQGARRMECGNQHTNAFGDVLAGSANVGDGPAAAAGENPLEVSPGRRDRRRRARRHDDIGVAGKCFTHTAGGARLSAVCARASARPRAAPLTATVSSAAVVSRLTSAPPLSGAVLRRGRRHLATSPAVSRVSPRCQRCSCRLGRRWDEPAGVAAVAVPAQRIRDGDPRVRAHDEAAGHGAPTPGAARGLLLTQKVHKLTTTGAQNAH
jgi:hypothetical protein